MDIKRITGLLLLTIIAASCTMILDPKPANKLSSWEHAATTNLDIYYQPNSPAERDIDTIKRIQQDAFDRIVTTLDSDYKGPIQIYLYTHQDQSNGLTESSANGLAHPYVESVEAIYSDELKAIGREGVAAHEMVHVVATLTLANPQSRVLSEGLAVALDDFWNDPRRSITTLHGWSVYYYQSEAMPSLTKLSDDWNSYTPNLSYPVSGSFVRYLIDYYGIEKFKKMYIKAESKSLARAFEIEYNIPFAEVESAWRTYLVQYSSQRYYESTYHNAFSG